MKYATKARIVQVALPLAVISSFMFVGYHATHSLFAQAPLPQGVGITTDQSRYTTKQTVTVLLYNTSSSSVQVSNNCPNEPLMVYRQTGRQWQQVHATTNDKKCAGEPRAYTIPVGRTIPVDYTYWHSLFAQPGTYRIVAPLLAYDNGPSVTFSVTP